MLGASGVTVFVLDILRPPSRAGGHGAEGACLPLLPSPEAGSVLASVEARCVCGGDGTEQQDRGGAAASPEARSIGSHGPGPGANDN